LAQRPITEYSNIIHLKTAKINPNPKKQPLNLTPPIQERTSAAQEATARIREKSRIFITEVERKLKCYKTRGKEFSFVGLT